MANEQSSTANAPITPDNLKLITGIGLAIERRLHEAGVYTFAQLAALTAADAGALVGDVAGMSPERISQQGWIEQARELAAESAPAATDVTTQTSGNNQHYATFTVELLLDDQNNVRRTRVVHVQNRNESAWVGWQASRLLEFIGKQANVHFPAEVSAIPKETPAPSLVTNVSSEPTLLSQPVDLQRMVLVYPSPTPDQPQPDNGQRTPDPPVEITPAPGEPAIEGTVQIIPLDAGVPSSIIEHGQPYHIQFTLQLTKMTAASIASRGYGVTVYAKRLSDGQRQIIGEAGGIVPSAEILHSEIPGVPLPRDTYRLEGTVTLSAATEITAVLGADFSRCTNVINGDSIMSKVKSHHGGDVFHRGINAPQSRYHAQGKFGRLFPSLPPFLPSQEALLALGQAGGVMDPGEAHNKDNPHIPAGFVFLGQFIDHDITFDTTSSLERQNDPEAIKNFRTPLLELDSVYGSGPGATPYVYEKDNLRLLIDDAAPRDLPRNSIGTALIGDPRNDENLLISQLQLAFLKFHNAIVQDAPNFETAQRLVRWHYQWIVLHEFLPLVVGQEVVDQIYKGNCYSTGRRFYNWRNEPFIPVEFAVAAYRFGHAQVPARLKVNDLFKANGRAEIPLFDPQEIGDADPDDLSGFGKRAERRFVDWKYLFDTGDGVHQPSKRIDTTLSGPLFNLPFFVGTGDISSLAQRNLLRGLAFGLPSGQAVAQAMCVEPLAPADLDNIKVLQYRDHTGSYKQIKTGFDRETPLWFYILAEAEVCENGARLGPVGGRIVAEVLIGLLEGDRLSFVRANPRWKPTLGEQPGQFRMRDLFAVAGSSSE